MISPPSRVVCAGNIVFDILVRPVEEIRFGVTTWVESMEQHMGGNGANTSFTLARLGVPVALYGLVGADAFGRAVREKLRAAGVDVTQLGESSLPTAATVALVNADGARAFLHQPGASREAFPQALTFTPQEGAHFHLANVFSTPGLRATAAATLQQARAAGFSTSLDTGWDALGEWLSVIGPLLPSVDLLFVNEDEARVLSGQTDEQAIGRFFREHGTGSVVLKLGARGCLVFHEQESTAAPGFPVPVVDTTGAGDCFAGGFFAGLHYGLSMEEAARFANAVGALSIQKLGATDGVRGFVETLDWIAAQ